MEVVLVRPRWTAFALAMVLAARAAAAAPADPHAVILVLDGTRADRFYALLDAGKLPQIDRHLARRGLRVETATTVFPSTTGPTYAPFVTGLFPGRSDLPGLRWYDRTSGRSTIYAGREFGRINSDLTKDFPTLYELIGARSVAVFGMVDRGATTSKTPFLDLAVPKLKGDFEAMDVALTDEMIAAAFESGEVPRLMFMSFHAPDSVGHELGDQNPAYDRSIEAADVQVGRLVQRLKDAGLYDSTYFALSADHGQSPVKERMSLAAHLEQHGLKVRDCIAREAILHNLRSESKSRDYDVHVEVNGNAAVFFYLNPEGRDPSERILADEARHFPTRAGAKVDLEALLLEAPATDLVLTRIAPGRYRVASRAGAAELAVEGGGSPEAPPGPSAKLSYSILDGADPLGYAQSPEAAPLVGKGFQPANTWFKASAGTEYPDAPLQIAQLMESRRAPDLAVSAAPGWEPWTEGQAGLHGSLRKEHMRVPMLFAGPDVPVRTVARARTADVFATVAEALGLAPKPGVDGVALPWRSRGGPPGLAEYQALQARIDAALASPGDPAAEADRKAAEVASQSLAATMAKELAGRGGAPLAEVLAWAARDPRTFTHAADLLAALETSLPPGKARSDQAAQRAGAAFLPRAAKLAADYVAVLREVVAGERALAQGFDPARLGRLPARMPLLLDEDRLRSLLEAVVPLALAAGDRAAFSVLERASSEAALADSLRELTARIEALAKRRRRHPGP